MGAPKKPTRANDYAVAMALNESVGGIFFILGLFQVLGPRKEFDHVELNRAYIFLVNELEILYNSNPKLLEIKPEPTWRRFDLIKHRMREVEKYLHENGPGTDSEHTSRLERLCIISEQETPELSPKQKKYIKHTRKIVDKYAAVLMEISENSPKYETPDFYIPEFIFIYKHDGTVLASDAFFPFRDNIDLLQGKGIRAIVQPGGSQRDPEVIQACDELGIAMVFTGQRHFRH